MITVKELEHLAQLSRIDLSEDDKKSLIKEFDSILGYVDQINNVQVPETSEQYVQINTVHADQDAYESQTYSDKMIAGAPDSQDGFYKVQKIL